MSNIEMTEIPLKDKSGNVVSKMAIFKQKPITDDLSELENAVKEYVGDSKYNVFVDTNLQDSWTRIIFQGDPSIFTFDDDVFELFTNQTLKDLRL